MEEFIDIESVESGENEEHEKFVHNEAQKYSNYFPKHRHVFNIHTVTVGHPHPHQLSEGTVLACVDPPPITYIHNMDPMFYNPESEDQPAHVSNAQLEAIVYACQAFQETIRVDLPLKYRSLNPSSMVRQGFCLGDGTGTGKSRVLAGILYECHLSDVKQVLLVTENIKLFESIKNEISYFIEGKRFVTIDKDEDLAKDATDAVLLVTYTTLSSKEKLTKVENWLKGKTKFEGLFIFDEAHNAKSAHDPSNPSIAGEIVDKLQHKYPMARVVYSSATAASEPVHLLYMSRLGIIGPESAYKTAEEFKDSMTKLGVVALELIAAELKMKGLFLSRMVSLDKVHVHAVTALKKESFVEIYNRCSQLWILLIKYMSSRKDEVVDKGEGKHEYLSKSGNFHSNAQTFFGSLVLSSKLSQAANITRKSLLQNKSVIIGIQTTGESQFVKFDKDVWNKGRPYSNAASILRDTFNMLGIPVGCPKIYLKDGSVERIGDWSDEQEEECKSRAAGIFRDELNSTITLDGNVSKKRKVEPPTVFTMWPNYSSGCYWPEIGTPSQLTWNFEDAARDITPETLAKLFHQLVPFLPINPLDELVDRLGVDNVAEITGRHMQYVAGKGSNVWIKKLKDKTDPENEFMDFKKRICIISQAGSTGISLHSDKSRKNQQQRVHITLQYSWSPDQLLQQIGRSHRSNQLHIPEYYIVRSPIPGEIRFIAIVGKRLGQLGAMCKGQAKASPLDDHLHVYERVCSKSGIIAVNRAIDELMKDQVTRNVLEVVQIHKIGTKKHHFTKSNDEEMSRCFNRNLLLPLEVQQTFMDLVYCELDKLKDDAYTPLNELPGQYATVEFLGTEDFIAASGFPIFLHQFRMSRVANESTIRNAISKASGQVEFYENGAETMLLNITSDGKKIAYYPFCREPKLISKRDMKGWHPTSEGNFFFFWDHLAKKLEKSPGCIHVAKIGRCAKKGCMSKWGVRNFYVVSGFCSYFVERLPTQYNLNLRLVKVMYKVDSIDQEVIGILLDSDKVAEIIHWIRSKFELHTD